MVRFLSLLAFLISALMGTALPEVISSLEKDGIITQIDGNWMLTQDGVDLKAELGLAEDGYRGAQVNVPSVGSQLEDLLEKME
jgi:predicted methyltransferase